MAKGYFRKYRYVIRTTDGKGIPASSVAQVEKLAQKYNINHVETETGNVALEQFLLLEKEPTP